MMIKVNYLCPVCKSRLFPYDYHPDFFCGDEVIFLDCKKCGENRFVSFKEMIRFGWGDVFKKKENYDRIMVKRRLYGKEDLPDWE